MERREEMTQLINALKAARKVIASLSGTSFLEVRETVLAELHEHQVKLASLQKHAFKTFGVLLLELSADTNIRADPDTVKVILDIIDELVESIYNVQKQEMYNDQDKTKYYQFDL